MNISPPHNRSNRPVLGSDAIDRAVSHAENARQSNWASPPRQPPEPTYTPGRHNFSPPSGFSVTHEAVDYFSGQTGGRKSLRATVNLGLVVSGRIAIALGLGGVYTGLKESTWPIVGGSLGILVGCLLIAYGAQRFFEDTAQFNRRLAALCAGASGVGAVLATGGGVFYTYAHKTMNMPALYTAVAVRTAGNVLLFCAMPSGFTSSEIVWGDCPINNRVAVRDGAYAHGVALLMAWAHISAPDPPAPLWAREGLQCVGMALVSLGASLARTDMSRDQARQRHTLFLERRTTHADAAVALQPLVPQSSTSAAVRSDSSVPDVVLTPSSEPRRQQSLSTPPPGQTPPRGPHRHNRLQDFAATFLPALLSRAEH